MCPAGPRTLRRVKWVVRAEDLVVLGALCVPLLHIHRWQLAEFGEYLAQRPTSRLGRFRFATMRYEVGDRRAVAGHGEALPGGNPAHDLGVVVTEFPLADLGHAPER